jgi:hypothetical protein
VTDHDRTTDEHEHERTVEKKRGKGHEGAVSGAVLGTVAVGPLGAPIGAAAGAVVDALKPDADAPPSHTHDLDAPCYDGCPAWHSEK